MYYAFAVGAFKRLKRLPDMAYRIRKRDRAHFKALGKVGPLYQLCCKHKASADLRRGAITHDVRVFQACQNLRFPLEAFETNRIALGDLGKHTQNFIALLRHIANFVARAFAIALHHIDKLVVAYYGS